MQLAIITRYYIYYIYYYSILIKSSSVIVDYNSPVTAPAFWIFAERDTPENAVLGNATHFGELTRRTGHRYRKLVLISCDFDI